MKRDPRLHGLSSDHHQALVLARRLGEKHPAWTPADGEELSRRYYAELEPHFRIEEDVLLPALRQAGAADLAGRTLADHEFLRAMLARARTGDGDAARAFGERLHEHVRFEERVLFPACEERLPAEVLDAVGHRGPSAT